MIKVTLAILLEEMKDFHYDLNLYSGKNPSFTGFDAISDSNVSFNSDTLYIGFLSEALKCEKRKNNYIFCVRDRIEDSLETPALLDGTVIFDESTTIQDLIHVVSSCFNKISNWISDMQTAILKQKNETDFLSLSDSIIGNYISISDSALVLVGNTANIPIDCPTALSLINKGYHSNDTLSEFRKNDLLNIWMNSKGTEVHPPDKQLSKYYTVNYVFKYNNTYFRHVVMSCNNKKPTTGVVDLFNILVNYLSILVESRWNETAKNYHIYDSLLTDLLDDSQISKDELIQRSNNTSIKYDSWYRLLIFKANFERDFIAERLERSIKAFFPNSICFMYKKSFLVLLPYTEKPADKYDGISLDNILEEYDAKCTVSIPFNSLLNLRSAYMQTISLFNLKIATDTNVDFHCYMTDCLPLRLTNFADNPFTFLLAESNGSKDYWFNCQYHEMLKKLDDYDKAHQTETLNLLYHYISNERKPLLTSEIVHMHRNTIAHHINHIEEMLGISLEDNAMRMQLSCAYLLLRLYGFSNN